MASYAYFTEAQRKEFKEAFDMFDEHRTGHITTTQLGKIMRCLGHYSTEEELQDLLGDFDSDRNGSIEFPEFLSVLEKKAALQYRDPMKCVDPDEALREEFKIIDKKQTGYIDKEELGEMMAKLGENLTDRELTAMFVEADENGDGKINFEEFKAMVQS